jgi:uncharacterized protein YyaL (SSP411 family)
VATPEGEPFFAGTYFPRRSRGGRPGLVELLEKLAGLWEDRREQVKAGAERATRVLKGISGGDAGELVGERELESAFRHFDARFDEHHGGFGRAPKFPTPHVLLFLLRYGERTGEERATRMVTATLDAMRRGGIFDQLGYGFHRYSTDARWLVPHFEKMLYDQALLALAYLEAHQATGEERFGRVASEVLSYVVRELADGQGGFHSAEDADSEGGEGAFYTWTADELEAALGPDDAQLARRAFGVRSRGNFAQEADGALTGRNVLHTGESLSALAGELGLGEDVLATRLESIRLRLLERRARRPRPSVDDKVLADWNGLAIAALARGGAVLGEERWTATALGAADFLLATLRDERGRLLHRWRRGKAGIAATAEDYAYLVWGLLELYDAVLEPRWLAEALRLDDELFARCWDPEEGAYFLAASDAADLPVRRKEAYDGALPSANAVAAWNGYRLARLTGDHEREERARAVERAFGGGVRKGPGAHAALLIAADFRLGPAREVVVAGPRGHRSTRALLEVVRERYAPRSVVLLRPADDDGEEVARLAPFTRSMTAAGGAARAYFCRDFACETPTGDPEELRARMRG